MKLAGQLDHYVALFHQVLTKNALGEEVASWPTAYANVWADKKDSAATRRGAKETVGDQFSLIQYTEFTIRFRLDLLATDRVLDDQNNLYEIIQLGEIGRRIGQVLLCRTVTP